MPGRETFFTPEEEELERAFADKYGNGVFMGSGFVYPLFPISPKPSISNDRRKFNQSVAALNEWLRNMTEAEMEFSGRSKPEIEEYFSSAEKLEEFVDFRRAAYAGWLVTNPVFRDDLRDFRKRRSVLIKRDGKLPHSPRIFFGKLPKPIPKRRQGFFVDYTEVYRSWSIDGLSTWDLPIPMRLQFGNGGAEDLNHISEAGITVFLPWFLLRDKQLTMERLASAQRTYAPTNHLNSWLDGTPKNFGVHRYAVLLRLYICLELVLRARYGSRIINRLGLFDEAFALYLNGGRSRAGKSTVTAESVRKLRLVMSDRLDSKKKKSKRKKLTCLE